MHINTGCGETAELKVAVFWDVTPYRRYVSTRLHGATYIVTVVRTWSVTKCGCFNVENDDESRYQRSLNCDISRHQNVTEYWPRYYNYKKLLLDGLIVWLFGDAGCTKEAWEGVDWIYLAQDKDRWRAVVNAVTKRWLL
jgi:hypothetical protein